MVGVNEDVTASKQAAVALVQSAERLRVALAASQLGIWRHDMRTNLIDWDERTRAIFGVPRDEPPPAGEAFFSLVVDEDHSHVRAAWESGLRADEPYHVRFRARRRDGVVRHVELHGIVHTGADGRPEWIIGVANDVTEVVRAAEEAGRMRDQLLQSQKMETLAWPAARSRMVQTLLTGINGFVELGAVNLPHEHEALAFLADARRGVSQASTMWCGASCRFPAVLQLTARLDPAR